MTDFFSDVAVLIDSCSRELGDPQPWPAPDGYPDSLALCIIDAIYSVGARYSLVMTIIERYREMRAEAGGNADVDSADDLTATFSHAGGLDRWAARLDGRLRGEMFVVPRKAQGVAAAANVLREVGVVTTVDLKDAVRTPETERSLQRAWRGALGPGCANTWQHLLRLAQASTEQPDRAVIRYIASAIGVQPALLTAQQAARLMDEVAGATRWDTSALGHAIWRYQSGRPPRIVNLPAL